MSLQSLEFLEPNSKCSKRNKKDKSNINSVTKWQNDTIHIAICLFFYFSYCISNLGLKTMWIVMIYLVNTYKFVPLFLPFTFCNFENGIMVACEEWDHRIFPPRCSCGESEASWELIGIPCRAKCSFLWPMNKWGKLGFTILEFTT
jgi:hypothetical protein